MTMRLTRVRGIPRRVRIREERASALARKVDFTTGDLERVLPLEVRIEIAGGRTSTASAMRAAQVQSRLERVGARAWTVGLEGSEAIVHAEVDPDQLEHAASLAFVRRISLS